MIERLYEYLVHHPDGASSEELLDQIFAEPGDDSTFGRDFLAALLADDPRFQTDVARDRWTLASKQVLDDRLSEAPLVVVDLETTGQRPEEAGVTEIGAVRLCGYEEVGRFETLVNPGRPIPPYVSNLTGITDAMVADAPRAADAIAEFVKFADGSVLVAHNAAFDVAVLDVASRDLLGRPLGLPSLCTFKLAKRLLPELSRASLDGLAAFFGLAKAARHRALADAELTTAILVRMMRRLEHSREITVAELLASQDDPAAPRRLDIRVPRRRLEALPERPGVFWLIGEDGDALFVGQADDLRRRVLSYFVARSHLSDRQFEMISQAVDVGFRRADTTIERSLIEAEEIRRRNPTFNRADRHLPRMNFVKIQRRGRYPRVLVGSRVAADGALYLGPLRSRNFADDACAMVARLFRLRTCPGSLRPAPTVEPCWLGPAGWCASPCNAAIDMAGYRKLAERAERTLAEGPQALRALVNGSAAQGATEHGSRDVAVLGRLAKLHRKRHWLVNADNYVVAVPATEGGLWIAVVLGGLCQRLRRVTTAAELAEAVAWDSDLKPGGRATALEADLSSVLAYWVRIALESVDLLILDLDPDDVARSLEQTIDELSALVEAA